MCVTHMCVLQTRQNRASLKYLGVNLSGNRYNKYQRNVNLAFLMIFNINKMN